MKDGFYRCQAADGARAYNCSGEYERVLELLARERRGLVVDVGCWSGAFLRLALREGFTALGLDGDPGLNECQEVPVRQARFDRPLQLDDGSADHVVCLQTVEHVENPFLLVRELARIVRPGGLVVVSTPNILEYWTRLRFLITGFHEACPRPHRAHDGVRFFHHINLIEYPRLAYAFEVAGLDVETVCTNRYRKSAAWAGAVLYLLTRLWTPRALRDEDDPLQRERNKIHLARMVGPTLLLGRTLIMTGRKRSARFEAAP
ncbi:MAG: class I SAM-dependent methyltransferase [Candidatus Riflebacteria bacterium]|nr:class I SAM-dependent methyltransferase [Candidatus Riflebacteria bacterium]